MTTPHSYVVGGNVITGHPSPHTTLIVVKFNPEGSPYKRSLRSHSNELTSTSSENYDYNGKTISKADTNGTTSYSWDFDDRLTSVTLPNSGRTVTFKYDPFGRRIYKQSPNATSIFAYDRANFVETVNATGSEVAHYAQSLNIDEPLAMQRGTTTDYYEADGLGSITSLTSSAGPLANTCTYDSFGNITNSTGSVTNFFRYTAREFDTETNLQFSRARCYPYMSICLPCPPTPDAAWVTEHSDDQFVVSGWDSRTFSIVTTDTNRYCLPVLTS